MAWENAFTSRDSIPYIDLHRRRREERRAALGKSRQSCQVLFLLLCAGVLPLTGMTLRMQRMRAAIVRLRGEANEANRNAEQVTGADAALDMQLARWARFEAARGRRQSWGRVIGAIAAGVPRSVYLETMQIQTGDQEERVELRGAAENMNSLRAFTQSLESSPFLTRLFLTETTAMPALGREGIVFRIDARGDRSLTVPDE